MLIFFLGLKIAKLKNEQEKIKIKTGALKLNHKKINKELKSCTDLISKCNNLIPGSKHEIDEPAVNHCLTLVCLVSSRQDKHEVKKILLYLVVNINGTYITIY